MKEGWGSALALLEGQGVLGGYLGVLCSGAGKETVERDGGEGSERPGWDPAALRTLPVGV